jgi:hypothetical protein
MKIRLREGLAMSIYKATSQFVESSNYLTTKELHDNFINLTLARHGLDETSDAYKVLSEKTEEARNLLLKRRHKDARRKGW